MPKKKKKAINFITKTVSKEDRSLAIPIAKVEEMFQMYSAGMSANAISRQLGISSNTIHNYINRGDVDRGVKPFVERRAELLENLKVITHEKIEAIYSELLEKMHGYFTVAGDRWLERMRNAEMLDSEDLYKEENEAKLKATQAKALNPGTKDILAILKGFKEIATLLAPPESSTINIQQNSLNISKEDVKDFFDGKLKQSLDVSDREELDALIARKSFESEE